MRFPCIVLRSSWLNMVWLRRWKCQGTDRDERNSIKTDWRKFFVVLFLLHTPDPLNHLHFFQTQFAASEHFVGIYFSCELCRFKLYIGNVQFPRNFFIM